MFNIFKAYKSRVFLVKFSKSGRNLVWSKHTDCFKRYSCPALVKSLGYHFVITADYRGRKEKRIFTPYSSKVCAQAQCVKRQLCFADIILYVFIYNRQLAHNIAVAVAFRTKREKFSHKIQKVRFCKNV